MANKRSKGIFGAVKANIHTKLILGMTMLAILPLTAVGVFINWWTSNDLLEQAGRSTQETASRTADMVVQQLTENIHMLEALAVSNEVQEKLREANSSYFGNDQQIYSDLLTEDRQWSSAASAFVTSGGLSGRGNIVGTELIRKIVDENTNVSTSMLQGFKKRFPNHVEVFLTDRFGANVASTGVTSDYYQADEEWWQSAFRQGGGAVYLGKPALDKSASAIAMVIAVPVRNKTNDIIGILRSTLEVSEIRTLLENVRLGKTGRVVIADVDGNIIFDPIRQPDPDQKLPSDISSAKITQKNSPGWIEASSFNNEPAIVGFSRAQRETGLPALERLQWTAVAVIESEEALAPVADSTRFQLILGFMFALTAIATAFYLSSRFTAQIKLIMKLFNELRKGNYEMRAPVITRDELGEMTAGLNRMLDETLALHQTKREREQLQDSIMKLLNEVSKLAEGDLTVNAEVRADITGAIADAFNYMTGELREIISRVQNMSVQVGVSVKETGEITERLAEAGEEQAKRILAAKDEVEAMADAMRRISETALACKGVAQQSLSTARQGTEAVRESMDGMIGIREHVLETSKRIKRLGEQSQEIGEIVQLISDIAYRTGVLALNASIQAARAGESGRGFAIVAEEVEQLAKRSTEAARNIGDLVKSIQSGTHEAVTAMEDSTREVVEGSRRADLAGRALSEIEKVSAQLSDLIQSISVAAELQAQGSGDVSRTMITLSETTQSTASDIKQSVSSVNGLVVLANDLRASVASFKLPVNGNGSY